MKVISCCNETNIETSTCKAFEHCPGGSGGILILSKSFRFWIFLDSEAVSMNKTV